MNKKQRTLYSQLNSRRVKRWEVMFAKMIDAVLKKQVSQITGIAKKQGVDAARAEADKIITIPGLAEVIRRIYVYVGLASARRVLKEIRKSAREPEKKYAGFGYDEMWTNSIIKYFQLHLLSKAVVPISAETRRLILEVISKGVQEGWSTDKIIEYLLSDEFTEQRARLITRTEIVKAQYYGEELGIEASPWETIQKWISAHDHRVRSSHRKIDGETIDEDGRFKVDRIRKGIVIGYDMMKGPGDPSASIENVANCRCIRSATAKRDENGRLIRKSKNIVALPS